MTPTTQLDGGLYYQGGCRVHGTSIVLPEDEESETLFPQPTKNGGHRGLESTRRRSNHSQSVSPSSGSNWRQFSAATAQKKGRGEAGPLVPIGPIDPYWFHFVHFVHGLPMDPHLYGSAGIIMDTHHGSTLWSEM